MIVTIGSNACRVVYTRYSIEMEIKSITDKKIIEFGYILVALFPHKWYTTVIKQLIGYIGVMVGMWEGFI